MTTFSPARKPLARGALARHLVCGALGLLGPLACSSPAAPPPPATPAAAPTTPAPPVQACAPPVDLEAGPVVLRPEGNPHPEMLSFSPDGQRLAIVDQANNLQVRDARTSELLFDFKTDVEEPDKNRSGERLRLDWSASGDLIGLYFRDRIFVWDLRPAGPAGAPSASPGLAGKPPTRMSSYWVDSATGTLHHDIPESGFELGSIRVARAAPLDTSPSPPPRLRRPGYNSLRMPPREPRLPRSPAAFMPVALVPSWPLALGIATLSEGTLTARSLSTLEPTATHAATQESTFDLARDGRTLIHMQGSSLALIDAASGKVLLEHKRPFHGRLPRNEWVFRRDVFTDRSRMLFLYPKDIPEYDVVVLDLSSPSPVRAMTAKGPGTYQDMLKSRFGIDGSVLCTPDYGGRCTAWDLGTGRRLGPRAAPEQDNHEDAFSPDGQQRAVLLGEDVQVTEIRTKRVLWSLPSRGLPLRVRHIDVSPDGQQMALIPAAPGPTFLQVGTGQIRQHMLPLSPHHELGGVAFGLPGEAHVSFGPSSNQLTFWSPPLTPWVEAGAGRGVQAARWSPDSRLLAVIDLDGGVTLRTERTPRLVSLAGIVAAELRFTADSSLLVGMGQDGSLMAWPTAPDREPAGPWSFGLGARFEPAPEHEKGKTHEVLVHSPASGEVIGLDLETGATQRQADCLPGEHASSLGLSVGGHSLLLGAGKGPAALCELTTGRLVTRLAPGEATLRSAAAYDLSGMRVATVGEEGEGSLVRVRDTASGHVLFTLPFPDTRPAEIEPVFTAQALVVRHPQGASVHPLKDCHSAELRLVDRNVLLGWLAVDDTGHFDGNYLGQPASWVRGPGGYLDENERRQHHLPGLLLGVKEGPLAILSSENQRPIPP